jgi:hypothetical protein
MHTCPPPKHKAAHQTAIPRPDGRLTLLAVETPVRVKKASLCAMKAHETNDFGIGPHRAVEGRQEIPMRTPLQLAECYEQSAANVEVQL